MKAHLLLPLFAWSGVACSTPGDPPPPPVAPPDAPPPPDCSAPPSPNHTVYYVARGEPGADNERCDGLAPTDEGGGRCPFADLGSARVREVLYVDPATGTVGTRAVTLMLRAGTYPVEPLETIPGEPPIGLWLSGNGDSADDEVVLRSYGCETAILDGSCTSSHELCNLPSYPGHLHTLINLWGRHVRVEGITIQNVARWNITVQASAVAIVGNRLLGPDGDDSDSIKSFDGSGPDVVVAYNELSDGYEQAIDLTSGHGWTVANNHIHGGDKGIGMKLGASDVSIQNNHFHDLETEAVSLGGATSEHTGQFEAERVHVAHNRIEDIGGAAGKFLYCGDCSFTDNDVRRAGLGVLATAEETDCPACTATVGARIVDNRFADSVGGAGAPPGVFQALDAAVMGELESDRNLYCTGDPNLAGFWRGGDELLHFDEWREATGTDGDSRLLALTDPACTAAPPPLEVGPPAAPTLARRRASRRAHPGW